MEVIPVVTVKSAGGTTAALALATVWPPDRPWPVVVECDPAGGDIAGLFNLQPEPGLESLVLAMDRDGMGEGRHLDLGEHTQQLPGKKDLPGVHVVVAPVAPGRMIGLLTRLPNHMRLLAQTEADLLLDCGRLESASMQSDTTPTRELLHRAGLVIVVVRAEACELERLQAWLPVLSSNRTEVLVLLSQKGSYSESEVASVLGVEVLGSLPYDPDGAAAIGAGGISGRLAERMPLLRSARTVAKGLAGRLAAVESREAIAPPEHAEIVPLIEGAQ